MRISFIGAGKVGASLGRYFKENGIEVAGYYSRSQDSAAWAAEFTDSSHYHSLAEACKGDMIFFTVPDDAIAPAWEEAKPYIFGKIVAHCSGIHSSSIFSNRQKAGCSGYSIHPLCAISSREQSYGQLAQALFTIEGDAENMDAVLDIFEQCHARTRTISPDDKAKYHAAASLASNHMTAVFALAEKLFVECGFSETEAREELCNLAAGNLEHILEQGCVDSLTGPIERGDVATVAMHLDALNENEREAYLANARVLLEIAKKKNLGRNYTDMKSLLSHGYKQL